MVHFQRSFFQTLQKVFGHPEAKLKAPSLEESKRQCAEIKATPKEIREAKKQVKYVCEHCGYHSDPSGGRCPACGGWLRYYTLAERIEESRKLEKEWKNKT